jgi:rod shape determining protein RodA
LWGKGFLEGTQAKLNFLPARHTDFIFSVFTEEWGFIGGITLVGIYALFIARCLYFVGKTKDRSGTILTVGITSIFVTHIVINIGMVLGLFPIVGMPLPFMSYGGSAMLSNMIGIGLILNVRMRRYQY